MKYFRKCPKCGEYMTPTLQSRFGYAYTLWTCSCGYSSEVESASIDNKTTYDGGYASLTDKMIYIKPK